MLTKLASYLIWILSAMTYRCLPSGKVQLIMKGQNVRLLRELVFDLIISKGELCKGKHGK